MKLNRIYKVGALKTCQLLPAFPVCLTVWKLVTLGIHAVIATRTVWSGLAAVTFALLLCELGPVKLSLSNSPPPCPNFWQF